MNNSRESKDDVMARIQLEEVPSLIETNGVYSPIENSGRIQIIQRTPG